MDVSIQYPWFRRPYFPAYFPSRNYDQFFGEHIPDGDLFNPFFSMFYNRPFYRPFLPSWMDSGFSEVGTAPSLSADLHLHCTSGSSRNITFSYYL